jgi:hypothetical protein
MNCKFYSLVFLCLLGIQNTKVMGQSKNPYLNNDSLIKVHLLTNRYEIDSNASAVILYNKGEMVVNNSNNTFFYKYEQTAKIVSDKAIGDYAEVIIPRSNAANVTGIEAYSYNWEDDKIVTQKIERFNITKESYTQNTNLVKINIPNVKKGSVVYYTYTLDGWTNYSIPDWNLQKEHPVLYSEFTYKFPIYFILFPIERSNVAFRETKNTTELYNNCEACRYTTTGGNSTSSTWVRKNIPAYKHEPYSLSADT